MFKKFLCAILFAIIFSCKSDKTAPLEINDFSELVDELVTGEIAYNTTAFVEKYWRVVGNTGFNKSIYYVAEKLEEAGYILEDKATPEDILTYRIEKRPLKQPTWEAVNASVRIEGESSPLLEHKTNRNMIALNSFSTPKEGIKAEVVHINSIEELKTKIVKGKIVFSELYPNRLYKSAIVNGGALGILSYNNPKYLQPEKNTTSIQFRSIPFNAELKPWAIAMSYEAKERLKTKLNKGTVVVNVMVETKIYESEELTIVADIKGTKAPKERLVFSAHVQEPGANDNATGVGVALEMAVKTAELIKDKSLSLDRTLTFLWGDEIVSTRRYVKEDKKRAKDIKWGISLDMVGENTAVTGGTFLIEKMPDPSAIWTRGNDKHSEWGGSKMKLSDMTPHYLNDFVIDKFLTQGQRANWEVNTNPFEGGSDHVPFLRENIPSVLFWHFTDQFYHTDNDRLDKVSQETLKNVGVAALISALELSNANETSAVQIIKTIETAAIERLNEELKQGKIALSKGENLKIQLEIIDAWEDWYIKSIESTKDLVSKQKRIEETIENAKTTIKELAQKNKNALKQ